MSIQETVTSALALLENAPTDANHVAAVVVMPPDTGDFIIGNADGLVHLAIAALKAARGEAKAFKKEPWWVDYDLDWPIKGLQLDDSAHTCLPPTKTLFQELRGKILSLGLFFGAAVCLVVGFVTIVRLMIHLL